MQLLLRGALSDCLGDPNDGEARIIGLLNANGALPTNEIFQVNEKTLQRILLEKRLWRSGALLSATDIADLKGIADQCPLSGGFAVHQSRFLLKAVGEATTWDDDNICDPIQDAAERGSNMQPAQSIRIYPNPANTTLHLEAYSASTEEQLFELFSITGVKVKEMSIPALASVASFNIEQLPVGIYVYRLSGTAGKSAQGKLIINR
ncbi:MAG: T9SS type A sorting domain-containing protein [Saprospiraceae bacterium]|nr:T9SS type A sorting domain-containing protein [Saprospiraceae bacterium]